MIPFVPEGDRYKLVEQALLAEDFAVISKTVRTILENPEPALCDLLLRNFSSIIQAGSSDYNTLEDKLIDIIRIMPEKDQNPLLEQCLLQKDKQIRLDAIGYIVHSLKEPQVSLHSKMMTALDELLLDADRKISREATLLISFLSPTDQKIFHGKIFPIVRKEIFSSLDPFYPEEMADDHELISVASNEDQQVLRKEIADLVEKILGEGSWDSIPMVAGLLSEVPPDRQAELWDKFFLFLKQGLAAESQKRDEAVEMLSFVSTDLQKFFIDRLRKEGNNFCSELDGLARQTPLYAGQPSSFFKQSFDKTGSEITLLDRVPGNDNEASFKNRLIIRTIEPIPFSSWKKAYESYDFWLKKGFDYIPVEPIVGVSPERDSLKVSVYTRVLNGPSVRTWIEGAGLFKKEIMDQVTKIRAGLEELGVKHGHAHNDNFIVLFPRSEDGQVLVDQVPRVYVIDFDEAISSGK